METLGGCPAGGRSTTSTRRFGVISEAFGTSQVGRSVPKDCKLRRVKCLNKVTERDDRFIKKKVRASQCFNSFHRAERTLEGIEAVNMIRRGGSND